VKKIVLVSQGRVGFLKIAALVSVLEKNGHLEPVPVLVQRNGVNGPEEALVASFGLEGRIRRIAIDPGTPVGESAEIMLALERILTEVEPGFVVPGGHDNAAVAATLAASRMGIPVISLDAGLRSYDRSETDELNRLMIDSVAALHFVSEHSGVYNLMNEGVADEGILFVGNTSIDSFVTLVSEANRSDVLNEIQIEPRKFVTVLLDMPLRRETAGNRDLLCKVLESIAATIPVLLPCGNEPEASLKEAFGEISGIRVVAMPGSADLVRVLKESAFVLTDTDEFESELTVMNVPCLTMRQSTSRPSTVEVGTNVLVGFDEQEIMERASVILSGKPTSKTLIPEKWDGAAAKRVAEVLERAE
jgi:UDP-N-acetylglucosamine 2-epimerase (non-hydrolysing)